MLSAQELSELNQMKQSKSAFDGILAGLGEKIRLPGSKLKLVVGGVLLICLFMTRVASVLSIQK
jgi:hypothetical protein